MSRRRGHDWVKLSSQHSVARGLTVVFWQCRRCGSMKEAPKRPGASRVVAIPGGWGDCDAAVAAAVLKT